MNIQKIQYLFLSILLFCMPFNGNITQDEVFSQFEISMQSAGQGTEHKTGHSKSISEFQFTCPAGEFEYSYEISKIGSDYILDGQSPVNGGFDGLIIDAEAIGDMQQIIEEYNLYSWDGFDKTAPKHMYKTVNGYFHLIVLFDDDTSIVAHGDQAYPDGYKDAETALLKYFMQFN